MTISSIFSVIGEVIWLCLVAFWLAVCGVLSYAFLPSLTLAPGIQLLPIVLYITALCCIALLGWYKMQYRSHILNLLAVSAFGLTLLSFFVALLLMGEPEYFSLYESQDMMWLGIVGLVLWTVGNLFIVMANGLVLISMVIKPFLLVVLPLLILLVGWISLKIYRVS